MKSRGTAEFLRLRGRIYNDPKVQAARPQDQPSLCADKELRSTVIQFSSKDTGPYDSFASRVLCPIADTDQGFALGDVHQTSFDPSSIPVSQTPAMLTCICMICRYLH
jgi:hypothetical protein